MATKLNRICVTEGFVHHHFHIRLPTIEAAVTGTISPKDNTTEDCGPMCLRMTALHGSMVGLATTMRSAVQNLTAKINNMIYDFGNEAPTIFGRRRIVKKGVIDGLGSALKWFAGTATESDIHDLRNAMEVIRKSSSLASIDAIKTRQGLATFSKVAQERFDQIDSIIAREHHSISQVFEHVKSLHDTMFLEFSTSAVALTEVQKFSQIYADLMFDQALDSLLKGELSTNLISV